MPKVEQSKLRQTERMVLRDQKNNEVVNVIFPNGIQVGLDVLNFNYGVVLPNLSSQPSTTTNTLYALDGDIYFNGVLVAPSAGSNLTISDEGTDLTTTCASIDFVGAGVTATASGNDVTVTIPSSPGGSDTQVQFNDGGSFGGDAGMTYNKTTDALTVAGDIAVNGGDITSSAATVNVANATPTTVNIGGAATAVDIGAATGTTSINNDLVVDGSMYSLKSHESLMLSMQVFG